MTTTAIPCPLCSGAGTYVAAVEWSDGLGMAEHRCGLCDGAGTLPTSLASLALQQKQRAETAEAALRQLRVHVALYLATSAGRLPDPPLADATRPSSCPETWRRYLEDATADLPRVEAQP
jgi:hypothetical protein